MQIGKSKFTHKKFQGAKLREIHTNKKLTTLAILSFIFAHYIAVLIFFNN